MKEEFAVKSISRKEIADDMNTFSLELGLVHASPIVSPNDDRLTDELCEAWAQELRGLYDLGLEDSCDELGKAAEKILLKMGFLPSDPDRAELVQEKESLKNQIHYHQSMYNSLLLKLAAVVKKLDSLPSD